jgi:hypothetical protein
MLGAVVMLVAIVMLAETYGGSRCRTVALLLYGAVGRDWIANGEGIMMQFSYIAVFVCAAPLASRAVTRRAYMPRHQGLNLNNTIPLRHLSAGMDGRLVPITLPAITQTQIRITDLDFLPVPSGCGQSGEIGFPPDWRKLS